MVWGLVALPVAFVYGWAHPRREGTRQMWRTALLLGSLFASAFGLLGVLIGVNPVGLEASTPGMLLGSALVLALFALGVWLGHAIDSVLFRRRTA